MPKRKPGLRPLEELRAGFVPGAAPVPANLAAAIRRVRGKQKAPTKKLVSLRLDRETVDAYRRTGRGWQSRINDTLARAAKRLRVE